MSLKEKLKKLEERLNSLESLVNDLSKKIEILENLPYIKLTSQLPEHLVKTFIAVYKLEKATASQVAEQTKRARAVESAYLNQLMVMGYLKKRRVGRKAFFEVDYSSSLSKELLYFHRK
ncbi:MAG: transcriptional regulator [Candidatus Aenigmatarchaeota archaeon]